MKKFHDLLKNIFDGGIQLSGIPRISCGKLPPVPFEAILFSSPFTMALAASSTVAYSPQATAARIAPPSDGPSSVSRISMSRSRILARICCQTGALRSASAELRFFDLNPQGSCDFQGILQSEGILLQRTASAIWALVVSMPSPRKAPLTLGSLWGERSPII